MGMRNGRRLATNPRIDRSELHPMSEGKGEERVFAFESEFGADIQAMMFYGADADKEFISDLLVAFGGGD